MVEQITKKDLTKILELASSNFKFKMSESFEIVFDIIFKAVEHVERRLIDQRFQQLLLMSSEDWNRKYGYGGYPALASWIEILTGERILTDNEKQKKINNYSEQMKFYVSEISSIWLDDKHMNLENAFLVRYRDENKSHIKSIIDEFLGIKEFLSDVRVKKMGIHLRGQLIDDKKAFFNRMLAIAKKQNPLRYKIENKIELKALPLATFKKC